MDKLKLFITGIDTDAGKTVATAALANMLRSEGLSVITQKFIQTGNVGFSEDIQAHREMMGIGQQSVDLDHTTAPIIFSYPSSPQLAAQIDGRTIDLADVDRASERLASLYDVVLIEGAGGLMVPVSDSFFTIDYIASRNLPAALVTNGRLGSINHTILSLEALLSRGIPVEYVIYNTYFDNDKTIAADTLGFLQRYLKTRLPQTRLLVMTDHKNIVVKE